MITEIVTTTEGFYNLKSDWERLQEQDSDVTFYSTFEFVEAWWSVNQYDKAKRLFIITVIHGNKIVGIAPFYIYKKSKIKVSYYSVRFLGRGDFLGVLIQRDSKLENAIIKTIFDALIKNNDKWDRLYFTHIKSDTELAAYFFRMDEFNNNFEYLTECPRICFDKDKLGKEHSVWYIPKTVKNRINVLKKEHNYKFEIIKNNKEIYDLISKIHKLEQEFLNNIHGNKKRRSVYKDKDSVYIEKIYKNSNNIITFILKNSNDIIAYNTCYAHGNIIHSWNIAYNPKYYKFKPSKVLYYEIFTFMSQEMQGYTFDFGTGRYAWKFEWTSDFITDYSLDIWNNNSKKAKLLKKIFQFRKLFIH